MKVTTFKKNLQNVHDIWCIKPHQRALKEEFPEASFE
jgi:hypothetical protein